MPAPASVAKRNAPSGEICAIDTALVSPRGTSRTIPVRPRNVAPAASTTIPDTSRHADFWSEIRILAVPPSTTSIDVADLSNPEFGKNVSVNVTAFVEYGEYRLTPAAWTR